jgi:hypothetical protein
MLFAVIFVVGILCGIGAWLFEKYSKNFEITGSMILTIVCIICLLIGGIGGVNALFDYSAHDAHCYEIATTRAVLIDELYKYDEMREVDVNASPIYLELKEKVIDFNKNVLYAKEHNNIWLNYFCSNPAYTTVDVIELDVG